VLGGVLDVEGLSSYERLAEFTEPGERVLDLACGDGLLLQQMRGRGVTAFGIDRSAAELRAAQHRVGTRARLVRADASRLPVRDGVCDKVLCHFALMLLQPLELVVAEVARVARSGGLLCAAIPGPASQGELNAWAALRSALAAALAGSALDPPPLQDERALEPDALGSLLRTAGFDPVEWQRVEFRQMIPVAAAHLSLSLTYLPDLLADRDRIRFDSYLTDELVGMANNDGDVPMIETVNFVTAVRLERR
jgi:SAM-dependent methyltransferase